MKSSSATPSAAVIQRGDFFREEHGLARFGSGQIAPQRFLNAPLSDYAQWLRAFTERMKERVAVCCVEERRMSAGKNDDSKSEHSREGGAAPSEHQCGDPGAKPEPSGEQSTEYICEGDPADRCQRQ